MPTGLFEGKCDDVVPINILPVAQLVLGLAQHGAYLQAALEQMQAPGAMVGARLQTDRDLERLEVLSGLGSIAERLVCVADQAKRRGIELHGDGAFTP